MRVEANDGAQREQIAGRKVIGSAGMWLCTCFWCGQFDEFKPRVAEWHRESRRRLTGNSPNRQGIASVGSHRDIENLVSDAQNHPGVVSRNSRICGQDDDAVVFVAEAKFACRADHAVAYVTVRLTRGNFEVTGQYRSGQSHRHEITLGEVARATDDAANTRGIGVSVLGTHLNLTPANRLLELGEFRNTEHSTHHNGTSYISAHHLNGFDFEAGTDQRGSEGVAINLGW